MSGQSSIPFGTSQGPSRPPSRSGPAGNERPKARFWSPGPSQVQGNHKGQAGEPGRSKTISQGGGRLTPAGPQTTSYPAGILRSHSTAGHQGPQGTLGGGPRTQSRAGRDDSSSKSSSAASNMFPELHPNFPQFPPAGSFPEGYQSQGPSGPPRPPSRAGSTRPLSSGGPAGRSSPAPSGGSARMPSPVPSGGQPRRPPSAPPGTRAPASTAESREYYMSEIKKLIEPHHLKPVLEPGDGSKRVFPGKRQNGFIAKTEICDIYSYDEERSGRFHIAMPGPDEITALQRLLEKLKKAKGDDELCKWHKHEIEKMLPHPFKLECKRSDLPENKHIKNRLERPWIARVVAPDNVKSAIETMVVGRDPGRLGEYNLSAKGYTEFDTLRDLHGKVERADTRRKMDEMLKEQQKSKRR